MKILVYPIFFVSRSNKFYYCYKENYILRSLFLITACIMLIQCDKFYQSGGENHYTEWKHYLGDPGRSHYSQLSEFTSKNIKSLKVAWTNSTSPTVYSQDLKWLKKSKVQSMCSMCMHKAQNVWKVYTLCTKKCYGNSETETESETGAEAETETEGETGI